MLSTKRPAKPELLAPAGNMEKLRVAVAYGADAVYLGGKDFGLRNLGGNFDEEELLRGVEHCHRHGVRAYLTLNAYLGEEDLPRLQEYLERTASVPLDACIVSDPGVLALVREVTPQREIHLSTQANTTNSRSALFWERSGVSRINLAREMSLEGIRAVRGATGIGLEAFVHGALCISYSGRCLLSSAMAGRDANRGECAHPCRWGYALVEEKRPGEYFPVYEDAAGTFIFNSRDLCLLPHLPELIEAGVDSLKIEGRMKGIHYLGSVLRVYREALDRLLENPEEYRVRAEWMEELTRISHRGYTTGFLFGEPREVGQEYRSRYLRSHDFVAVAGGQLREGWITLQVRNRLAAGETLQLIGPGMREETLHLASMTDLEGNPLQVAHPNQVVLVESPFPAREHDLVRREKPAEQPA